MPVPPSPPARLYKRAGLGARDSQAAAAAAPCARCRHADGPVGRGGGPEGQATKGPWGRCFPAHQEVSWIWEVGGEGDWVRVWVRADHSGVP